MLPPLPLLPSGDTFSDAGSRKRLLSVDNCTNPPLPEDDPTDPPVAEMTKSPAPDPTYKSPDCELTATEPPFPVAPPLAARVSGPAATPNDNARTFRVIEPPLPLPAPLAARARGPAPLICSGAFAKKLNGSSNVKPMMPPLPLPTPLALMTPALVIFIFP